MAMAGTVRRRPVEDDRPVDVYDAVDALRAVVDALEIEDVRARAGRHRRLPSRSQRRGCSPAAPTWARSARSRDAVVNALGLERPVVAFEVVLDTLVAAPRRDRAVRARCRAFRRRRSISPSSVPDTVPADAIVRTLRAAGRTSSLEEVRPFDVFQSETLGAGRRSIAFALRFRAPDHTLTDSEIADLRQRAIDAVVAAHGAELRG